MSTLSCGVLFVNDGKLLIGHVTGQTQWDIPKGKIEHNETPIQAAIRETYEEAGIVVLEHDLIDLGKIPYRRGKQLNLFLFTGVVPKVKQCIDVVSTFKNKELDDFEYCDFGDLSMHLNKRMVRAILNSLFSFIGTNHND